MKSQGIEIDVTVRILGDDAGLYDLSKSLMNKQAFSSKFANAASKSIQDRVSE